MFGSINEGNNERGTSGVVHAQALAVNETRHDVSCTKRVLISLTLSRQDVGVLKKLFCLFVDTSRTVLGPTIVCKCRENASNTIVTISHRFVNDVGTKGHQN